MGTLIQDIKINSVEEAEEILKAAGTEDLFEKARTDGEMHPNGKWYWESSANRGKGDWRTIKGASKATPAASTTKPQPKAEEKKEDDKKPASIKWGDEVKEGLRWKIKEINVGEHVVGKIEKKLKNYSTNGKNYSNAKKVVYKLTFDISSLERLNKKLNKTKAIEFESMPKLNLIQQILEERTE